MSFKDTAIGRFLYIYAPYQYHLLVEYYQGTKGAEKSRNVRYHVIETVAFNSDNPVFRTKRFQRAMIAYRLYGHKPPEQTEWNLNDALYFARHSFAIHKAIEKCTEPAM